MSLTNAIRAAQDADTVLAEMKRCAKCKNLMPLDLFPRQRSAKTGRHSYCKGCYNLNRRNGLEPRRVIRHDLEGGQRFAHWTVLGFSHKVGSRRYFRVLCDCGEIRAVQVGNLVDGRTNSCGCVARQRASKRLLKPNNGSAISSIISAYQRNAATRGLVWELTRQDVDRLVRQGCHYCGEPAGNCMKAKHGPFRFNGLDRVDNSLGYQLSNVVPCCGLCNRCKNTLPPDEFIRWACRIAARRAKGII